MGNQQGHDEGDEGLEGNHRWWSVRVPDLKLTGNNLRDVGQKQHGMPFVVFILYRFLIAGYFLGFLIYFIIDSKESLGVKFLIYLTDLTYIEVNIYLWVAFINAVIDSVYHQEPTVRYTKGHKLRYQLQWLLFNISITVSIIVTLVYWPILWPMIPKGSKIPLELDLSVHFFPSIFCLLDLIITKTVVRFHHVIYPAAYLLAYGIFDLIYWAAGGTDPGGNPYIYPILDYTNAPGLTAATWIGLVIGVLLVHGLVKLIYYLRVRFLDLNPSSGSDGEREPLLI